MEQGCWVPRKEVASKVCSGVAHRERLIRAWRCGSCLRDLTKEEGISAGSRQDATSTPLVVARSYRDTSIKLSVDSIRNILREGRFLFGDASSLTGAS